MKKTVYENEWDKNIDRIYDLWQALKQRPESVDKVWDDLPYGLIEFVMDLTSRRITREEREDNYSIIIKDICDNCLDKQKVSIKQFKCVLNYSVNYNNNNLKYKYKLGNSK
jgi:hypothetical protein